jgi:hypothetical protein
MTFARRVARSRVIRNWPRCTRICVGLSQLAPDRRARAAMSPAAAAGTGLLSTSTHELMSGLSYSPPTGIWTKLRFTPPSQTIQDRGGRLGVAIQSPLPEGQEPALAEAILDSGGGVVLICWKHQHIPALAQAIPTVNATTIPTGWPSDRFDIIWKVALDPRHRMLRVGPSPPTTPGW